MPNKISTERKKHLHFSNFYRICLHMRHRGPAGRVCMVWSSKKQTESSCMQEPGSYVYRESPHFEISQFVIPTIPWFCFRPQFRESPLHDFEGKNPKKNLFGKNFWIFFRFLFIDFCLYVSLIAVWYILRFSLLDMTITRNSKRM